MHKILTAIGWVMAGFAILLTILIGAACSLELYGTIIGMVQHSPSEIVICTAITCSAIYGVIFTLFDWATPEAE